MRAVPPLPADRPVWLDDRLVAAADAAVSAFDHGLVAGDGIFETALVRDGRPFALTRHLRRLVRSAAGLGLTGPDPAALDLDRVRRGVAAVLGAAPLPLGRVRITVTGGASPLSSERGPGPLTLVVAASPIPPRGATADVVTVRWTRNECAATAGLKTTSYADNVIALAQARARGAGEAVLANTRGELCEGTGTNVALAVDGRLVTPPLSSGCLAGITRELALEWCDVVEEPVPYEALGTAREALLLSSTRGVHPIRLVDGRPLRTAPGPLTAAAQAAYDARAAETDDP